jgi:hypothetical protein
VEGLPLPILDTSAFANELRTLIETGALHGAEALVRDVVRQADHVELATELERDLGELTIEGWPAIAADMADARRQLPKRFAESEWQAVFIGLVHDTDTNGPHARIAFGFDAEPARETVTAGNGDPGLPIRGLERLDAIQREKRGDKADGDSSRHRQKQVLAAAIILLRFHQLVDRYAAEQGLPRPMALFVHVEHLSWPRKAEFGIEATRKLNVSAERFPHAGGAAILEERKSKRRAAYLKDTRRIITELREKDELLDLWPRWRGVLKRAKLSDFVRKELELTRGAIGGMCQVDLSRVKGEALYRAIAVARHPDDPEPALEPLEPDDRHALQLVVIAFAKKFGGERVEKRFADYTAAPEWALSSFG